MRDRVSITAAAKQLHLSTLAAGVLRKRMEAIIKTNGLLETPLNRGTVERESVLQILQNKQSQLFANPLPITYREGEWSETTSDAVMKVAQLAKKYIREVRRRRRQKGDSEDDIHEDDPQPETSTHEDLLFVQPSPSSASSPKGTTSRDSESYTAQLHDCVIQVRTDIKGLPPSTVYSASNLMKTDRTTIALRDFVGLLQRECQFDPGRHHLVLWVNGLPSYIMSASITAWNDGLQIIMGANETNICVDIVPIYPFVWLQSHEMVTDDSHSLTQAKSPSTIAPLDQGAFEEMEDNKPR